VTFCGPHSKTRQGQLYIWFAAVEKAQTLTAEISASPMNMKLGSLQATELYSLVLEAEIFDRCLSSCGKH